MTRTASLRMLLPLIGVLALTLVGATVNLTMGSLDD
jgi:hypothetical protein